MRSKSPIGSPPAGICRWGKVIIAATIVAVPFVGCVYDSGNRCGPGRKVSSAESQGLEICVCDTGYAYTPSGCVACGPNQVAGATGCICAPGFGRTDPTAACVACKANEATSASGSCECAPGFSRTSATEACIANPVGLGVACDGVTKNCTDAKYNYCQKDASAASGYCTNQGCTGAADCTGGFVCDTASATPYCRRAPIGAGKSCSSNADCAGSEATYCDTFVTHTCLVEGCTLTPDNCFTGSECCDLSTFGIAKPLCVAAGACTT